MMEGWRKRGPGTDDDGASPDTGEASSATRQPGPLRTDVAGATLIAVATLGMVAWAWAFVRTQFVEDEPGSLGGRLDLLADQTPVLLLSAAVAGIGIGLRTVAATQAGAPARPALSRPFAPILLGATAALVVLLGVAASVGDDDDDDLTLDLGISDLDSSRIEEVVPAVPPTVTIANAPAEPTHTLEVHRDGCGVFRSGQIGDDLTWVIKDQDGFQVLGRNAAGETQYRYFQPGTYTVVLETWGGGYYVDASNEVTITC